MAGRAKKVGKAAGRLGLYGSTRYTSKGARKGSRLKGTATVSGTTMAAQGVGAGLGYAAGKKAGIGAQTAVQGAQLGSAYGAIGGRRIAAKAGYIRRTKAPMRVRAVNKVAGTNFAKPDPVNTRNAKTGVHSSRTTAVRTSGRARRKGY